MKNIAIVGGGVAGLAAAHRLERARALGAPVSVTLFEASRRLGGIVGTDRRDGFVVERGPDSWVTEKPWAADLARELGLADQIMPCNESERRTYIVRGGRLVPMPVGMSFMVPGNMEAALGSPLFSEETKRRFAHERALSPADAPAWDESIASFTRRHFGDEMVEVLAEPLLAGVFGGDAEGLSAQAILPGLVRMERTYGSLIRALEESRARRDGTPRPVFTSLRDGIGTLVEALVAQLGPTQVRLGTPVERLERRDGAWHLHHAAGAEAFDAVLLATPAWAAARLLAPWDGELAGLLPSRHSSAITVALAYGSERASQLRIPPGFGLLVPRTERRLLLACTFVHQKFAHRAPGGGALLRGFLGGSMVDALAERSDEDLAAIVRYELMAILGEASGVLGTEPSFAHVQRWPRSMPQYEVGHLDRMERLAGRLERWPGLSLLGSAYKGVGIPDLVREARSAADAVLAMPDTST